MKEIKIAPSILSADFSKMGEEAEISRREAAPTSYTATSWTGVFVNNITFGIKMVEDLRKSPPSPLDCHL